MSHEKSKNNKKSSTPVLKNKGTDDPYKLTKLEKIQHYNAVLIEDLRSQFGFVIDRVVALDEKFTQIFKDHAEENRQNFAEIRFAFKKVFEKFDENEKRWDENDKRWDENDKRWDENKKQWNENKKLWGENDKLWKSNRQQWEQNQSEHQEIMQELKKVSEKVETHDLILKKICA